MTGRSKRKKTIARLIVLDDVDRYYLKRYRTLRKRYDGA